MRHSSFLSSSLPSHLNVQDTTSYPSSDYFPSSHTSRESSLSDESIVPSPDHHILYQLDIRNPWMTEDERNQWLQPHGYNFSDAFIASSESDFITTTAALSDHPQLYGDSVYPQAFQSGFSQQSVGSHRRLQSSSSVASAVDSPYSHTSSLPLQQYPSTYTQPSGFPQHIQASTWSWDPFAATSSAQHLPTPSGTPTPDHIAQATYGQHPRRTKHFTPDQQALRVRAHNSFIQSLNQQYKSGTYTQSQTQPQSAFAEMPRTPQTVHGDCGEAQQLGNVATTVPKLGRTVSDARADELYNPWSSTPAFGDPSAMPPRPQNQKFLQPQPPVLQERLDAAHEARSSSPSSPSGHASPFRNLPCGHSSNFNVQGVSQAPAAMPSGYAPIARNPAHASQSCQKPVKQENDELKTVSPKDAFPEQPMAKQEESYTSLFPEANNAPLQYAPHNAPTHDFRNFSSMGSSSFSYPAVSVSVAAQFDVSKRESTSQEPQYGPVYARANHNANVTYVPPPNLTSMETTKSEDSDQSDSAPSAQESGTERPSDTSAGSGAYPCTFTGNGSRCHERFDNSADLMRHKKEHNRPPGSSRGGFPVPKISQSGPHYCQYRNPETGEICGEKFTRPYDLTRHEDTKHTNRKKSRCPHCDDEKLFSRGDALTRHLRVVHPHLSSNTSKQRRRRSGA